MSQVVFCLLLLYWACPTLDGSAQWSYPGEEEACLKLCCASCYYTEHVKPWMAVHSGDIKEGKRNYLTLDQMVDFLNKYQRDPRLNEILFPFHSGDGTKKLIKQHEKDKNKSKILKNM